MVTGGGTAVRVGKSPGQEGRLVRPRLVKHRFYLDHLQIPSDEKGWLALALYREAHNLESDPYRFLGFFKIINILASTGKQQVAWIAKALPHVSDHDALERVSELKGQGHDVPKYLYESGRCAVAHAFSQPLVDPDDPEDLLRLRRDLVVISALAEHAIEHDLGIKSSRTCFREHLYELEGFRALLGPDLVAKLKGDEGVDASELPPFPRLGLRFREEPRFSAFERLSVVGMGIASGGIALGLASEDQLVGVRLGLDFKNERLGFDFQGGVGLRDDGSARSIQNEIDYNRLLQCCISNGQLEVWDEDNDKLMGRSDPIIPVNINSGASRRALEASTQQLVVELEKRRECGKQ
jgi:hypothetical protein